MKSCPECSRPPRTIYHVGKCPKAPTIEMPIVGSLGEDYDAWINMMARQIRKPIRLTHY